MYHQDSIFSSIIKPSFNEKVVLYDKNRVYNRFLFGASRKDIRPLVHAVDITIKLMFSQGIPMDDIRVTHAVYPQVAKRLKTRSGASPSAKTTARRIQRLANACWDALVERNLVKEFLGTSLRDLQAPRDLLFYLAAFSHLGIPFFEAVKRYPELLFWPGQWWDGKAETHPHT